MAIGLALGVIAATPAAAQPVLGPYAAACRGNDGAVLVTVDGFKQRTGNLRVQLYRADNSFLERGRWLQRIDLPVTRAGAMRICVPVPQPGSYAIAVRHDMDSSGSSGWNDGGGFSRNPRLSLTNLRPSARSVAINVGNTTLPVNVVLNYRFGLSIRPVRG
ncbi:DUF2141 domain-containing protein [Sphingosinicella sp. LHD-64]|uniref:DUF2141 domain-containing protein n=1 Tax=Sphingosinicella sp. LHD-64 TaxID=3072139 RepID=UPI00280EC49A|nr:DUF2141 domain-containing protein [Sphingosinicella sp. LHD-64]MDQ8755453.1 DUF2141 domain-containing protein [Sphingosinicella sp. LHD-64]